MTQHYWRTWHEAYDEPDSGLSARLAVVRTRVEIALDDAPDGPITILSLCAGQGRDLIPVLAEHPRRDDAKARLVEFDPVIANAARVAAAEAGLTNVEVVTGDAAQTDQYLDLAPADIVIACGIFGNISDEHIQTTIRGCASLTKQGGTVLWTRHRREPDAVPSIQKWFADAGFAELFISETVGHTNCVGAHRLDQAPTPLVGGWTLFKFVR